MSGAAPAVDLQTSVKREQVLSNEFVRALPASRGYGNYLAGVPGISGTGLGASATPSNNFFTSRGGRNSEGNIQLDGMNVGSSVGGGGVSGYQYDMSMPPKCRSRSPEVSRKSIGAGRPSTWFPRPAAIRSAAATSAASPGNGRRAATSTTSCAASGSPTCPR